MVIELLSRPLTPSEEIELSIRIEAGILAREVLEAGTTLLPCPRRELRALVVDGQDAWDMFYRSNLRLVHAVVDAVVGRRNRHLDDLFQEGCLGLAVALMRFDHQRGLRFSTFAWSWIRSYVQDAAVRLDYVHPLWLVKDAARLGGERARLVARWGRDVSDAELASHVGHSVAWVQARTAVTEYSSMEGVDMADPSSCTGLDEPVEPEWLADLGSAEAQVLRARYGFAGEVLGYADLAARMGVSESTVRRLERRGLGQAREILRDRVA
ncbi:MAG TPA: sigma-70 family RNA polymerase sigma factor [Propionibacteriaceae bacterium]|nr:sigma-70 family RNA polymerase sigma factor [Propionibacteriaceae bacterium]